MRPISVVIIEDDYEFETNYVNEPCPALKSLDDDGRVIYVGSLSKTLFPGLRLGFLVAPKNIVAEARAEARRGAGDPLYGYYTLGKLAIRKLRTDYATARIRVSVPAEYEAVSTGTRVSDGVTGLDHVTAFAADVPARYLTTIISRLPAAMAPSADDGRPRTFVYASAVAA